MNQGSGLLSHRGTLLYLLAATLQLCMWRLEKKSVEFMGSCLLFALAACGASESCQGVENSLG